MKNKIPKRSKTLISLGMSALFVLGVTTHAMASTDVEILDIPSYSDYGYRDLERFNLDIFADGEERRNYILSSPVLTQEEKDFLLEIPVTRDEQIEAILNDPRLTPEEQQYHIARFAIFDFDGDLRTSDIDVLPDILVKSIQEQNLIADERAAMTRVQISNVLVGVRHFPQIRGHYCGPATAQQTLDFMDRAVANNWNQNSISNAMLTGGIASGGTDLAVIRNFLNRSEHNLRHRFVSHRSTDRISIQNALLITLRANRPAIVRIETVPAANWPYQIGSGHFLNVSGIEIWRDQFTGSEAINRVRLTDPWPGSSFFSQGAPVYWVSFGNLLTAMNTGADRHNIGI